MDLKPIAKRLVSISAKASLLRPAIYTFYELKSRYSASWDREHPYDRLHGVHTSGSVPGFVLLPGDPLDNPTTGYLAIQPSIARAALAAIPNPQNCHFLDLGCGKGRSLLVASEFDFSATTGVELSPTLAQSACRNAATFSRAYPNRTRINIVTGDALAHNLPGEKLVVFLYNPFGRPLIAQLLSNIETSLRMVPRDIYIVYCNPVWAEVFDASNNLKRRYAAQVSHDPSEIGYGPDKSEAIIVWQNRDNPHPVPPGVLTAPVRTVIPGMRVEIDAQPTPNHA